MEKKLAAMLADNQSIFMELTKLQDRITSGEQAANRVNEQHAAELEKLRNEFIEQKQTAVICEEATNAPTTEPMAKHPNQQAEIIKRRIDSLETYFPKPYSNPYDFSNK